MVAVELRFGSGYGSGYGYGDGDLNEYLAALLSPLQSRELILAFWRSTKDGRAANNGKCAPVSVGTVHTEKGPLTLCKPGTLHATLKPKEWKGERWWIVGLSQPVIGTNEKLGSKQRTILRDLGPCPF